MSGDSRLLPFAFFFFNQFYLGVICTQENAPAMVYSLMEVCCATHFPVKNISCSPLCGSLCTLSPPCPASGNRPSALYTMGVSLVFPKMSSKEDCAVHIYLTMCVRVWVCSGACVCVQRPLMWSAFFFLLFSFLFIRQGSYSPGAFQIGETSMLRKCFPLQC